MIQAKNLYFKYNQEFVLNNINLEIKEGSFTAIIGANGSGKTTLAKHFNALLLPTKGEVIIDGLNTKKDEINARKKVGFVFQNFEDQLVHSIVEEDVAFGLENLGLKYGYINKIVNETLNRLKSLKNFERQSYDELLNIIINNCEEENLSDNEIEEIKLGLENVKQGKVKPIEQVAKELGISLF